MDEVAQPSRAAELHVPVMCDRILELLAPALSRPGAVHVDATLGMGGHAEAVLQAHPQCRLIGIDRDPQALDLARERLARFSDRIDLVQAVYDELPDVLDDVGLDSVDSILLDLGLSSLQIDRADRGFAYAVDSPLDMRMDGTASLTAAEVVNTYPADRLVKILRGYGEERFADRIVKRIVVEREREPFDRSGRLVAEISAAIPAAARATGGHPAKRTFQALRIEVNAELDALHAVIPAAIESLAVQGRLAVLAYHSLEDRPVKNAFRDATSDHAPVGLPMVPDHLRAQFRLLTRGAERPGADEVNDNPRAASARLRVIERIREKA